MKRILLDKEDFTKLLSGDVVEKDDTKIALSDIGYYNMIEIIVDAVSTPGENISH